MLNSLVQIIVTRFTGRPRAPQTTSCVLKYEPKVIRATVGCDPVCWCRFPRSRMGNMITDMCIGWLLKFGERKSGNQCRIRHEEREIRAGKEGRRLGLGLAVRQSFCLFYDSGYGEGGRCRGCAIVEVFLMSIVCQLGTVTKVYLLPMPIYASYLMPLWQPINTNSNVSAFTYMLKFEFSVKETNYVNMCYC